ncbi:MAG: cytochrome c oxidase accessory protein CcoG [Proteobacteria bacterium]|nr:cytochrome c oxidase accessory protein CcoG [Pseudomonadota bacterium]MCP4918399.1 cytochrome c oxidase accessory protein CcoG [Pseudomonadota bacterium]
MIAFLAALPWIPIGGKPAVLMDLGTRRLYAFGETFTPRDSALLVVIFLIMAFSLFLVTALWGRIWCGYACPQTVFLESWIRPLEEWIEGSRGVRIRRDNRGWTLDKAWRKGLKWTLFALLSIGLSLTLTSYFVPALELWSGDGPAGAYGVMFALAGGVFFDLAYFREQFCNFLCPYARFQGALTDERSQVVEYEVQIGEPRREKPRAATEGACIDCKKCVAVCPQGVDIRDGYQLNCINCGSCADACEGVLAKLGQGSLITYTSPDTRADQKGPRPRTIVYSALLVVLSVTLVVLLAQRQPVDASVARAPGTLFTVDADGAVRNTFLLMVTNNGSASVTPTITVDGSYELIVPPISIPAGESRMVPVVVRTDDVESRTQDLRLYVDDLEIKTTFKTGAES